MATEVPPDGCTIRREDPPVQEAMSSSRFVKSDAPVGPVVRRGILPLLLFPLSLQWATAVAAQRPPAPSELAPSAPQCREVVAPAAPSCEVVLLHGEPTGLLELADSDIVRIAVGAQRAVLDPVTGELRAPEVPYLAVPRRTLEMFRVPSQSLQPRPRPGGGWVLGLRGRMLQPLFGTVSPDGRPAVSHVWKPVDGPPDPPSGPSGEPPAKTTAKEGESDGSR